MRPPRWKAGSYYTPLPTGTIANSSALTLNELRLTPLDVPRATRVDQLAVEVGTAAASATVRLAVYADTGLGEPGVLVLDTGAVIDASTTGLKTVTVSLALAARRYHVGMVNQGSAVSLRAATSVSRPGIGATNAGLTTTYSNGNGASCVYQSSVSGACPSTFTVAGTRSQMPLIYLRAA